MLSFNLTGYYTLMNDEVNNPTHYNKNGIEVINVIETYAKGDFRLANVIKYVCRCEYKGRKLQDLQKAAWYLNRVIEELEAQADEECLLGGKWRTTEERGLTRDEVAEQFERETIMVPVITDIHEPGGTYVQPSLERVPDSDSPVHRDYYGYNPDAVEGHCGECGEPIFSRDAKISADHVPGTFCSLACLAEHKFWDNFKGTEGTE